MRDREWFTGSGGARLVEFIWRSPSPWCGGGKGMFLQLVKHLWSKFSPSASPPKSVHLHDRAEVTHSAYSVKLNSQQPLTVCVRLCVRFTKEVCAMCLPVFVFLALLGWWKKNVGVLLLVEVQILCGPLWTLGKFQGSTNLYFEGVYRLNYC